MGTFLRTEAKKYRFVCTGNLSVPTDKMSDYTDKRFIYFYSSFVFIIIKNRYTFSFSFK